MDSVFQFKPFIKKYCIHIFIVAFATVFLIAEYNRLGDFSVFLLASEDILSNKNIYTELYATGLHYYYSPFFALLVLPLTLLPYALSATLWKIFNFFLLYKSFGLLSKFHPKIKSQNKLFVLAFIAVLFTVYHNFHLVQMTVFILYITLVGLYLIFYRNHKVWGASLIALAINIKILPIVFIPYLFYRKQYKAGFAIVIVFIAMLYLPALVIGFDYNQTLLSEWWKLLNPSNSENIVDLSESGLHSLTTLISTWFSDFKNSFELDIDRHLLVLPTATLSLIINLVRLFIVSLSLYFFKWPPFRNAQSKVNQLWELSFLFLCIPLIFPHQQIYAFLFCLPAAYYTLYFLMQKKQLNIGHTKLKVIVILFCLAFILINLELFLGLYRHYFWHFKTLTYGAISLLITLLLCTPKHLPSESIKSTPSN